MKHSLLKRSTAASIIAFVFSLLITAQSFAAVDMLLEIEGMSAEGIYKGTVDQVTGNVFISKIPAGHYKMRLVVSGEALSPRMRSADGSTTPPSTIEISSFSWGVSQTSSTVSGTGLGTGKVAMGDMSVTKSKVAISGSGEELPKESVAATLPSGSYSNKSFPLTVRKAGKDQQEYYIIKLQDVIITGPAPSGTGSSTAIKAGYDLKANVKI